MSSSASFASSAVFFLASSTFVLFPLWTCRGSYLSQGILCYNDYWDDRCGHVAAHTYPREFCVITIIEMIDLELFILFAFCLGKCNGWWRCKYQRWDGVIHWMWISKINVEYVVRLTFLLCRGNILLSIICPIVQKICRFKSWNGMRNVYEVGQVQFAWHITWNDKGYLEWHRLPRYERRLTSEASSKVTWNDKGCLEWNRYPSIRARLIRQAMQ